METVKNRFNFVPIICHIKNNSKIVLKNEKKENEKKLKNRFKKYCKHIRQGKWI